MEYTTTYRIYRNRRYPGRILRIDTPAGPVYGRTSCVPEDTRSNQENLTRSPVVLGADGNLYQTDVRYADGVATCRLLRWTTAWDGSTPPSAATLASVTSAASLVAEYGLGIPINGAIAPCANGIVVGFVQMQFDGSPFTAYLNSDGSTSIVAGTNSPRDLMFSLPAVVMPGSVAVFTDGTYNLTYTGIGL